MIQNLDIKIKNTTVVDFVNRCKEMEGEIMPALQRMGYVSNLKLRPIGIWSSGKTVHTLCVELELKLKKTNIPVVFIEKNGDLYLHDEFSDDNFSIYNKKVSLFDVLKKVAQSFPNVEYYECLSDKSFYGVDVFDKNEHRKEYLYGENTKFLCSFYNTNDNYLEEDIEQER